MIRASIIGATGYAGRELIRILLAHPQVRLAHLTSRSMAGQRVSRAHPSLLGRCDKILEKPNLTKIARDSDVVFLATQSGEAMSFVDKLATNGRKIPKIIDLSADFRLKSVREYKVWYKLSHKAPGLLKKAVYGLPEIYRSRIREASLIANPGCYATSVILALAPLLKKRIISPKGIAVSSASGVSGAGRKLKSMVHFSEANENFQAYALEGHRHTPEIEQALSQIAGSIIHISFTPHLLPMTTGILSTIYAPLRRKIRSRNLESLYRDFYAEEPFVRILPFHVSPQTASVLGTNFCDISAHADARTGGVVILSALDNLVKGAAGQAVQNMNLLFGLDEKTALL